MPRYLLLTLDGPLQAYGAPAVDQHGVIDPFPGTALLTGLIANALGWTHGETDRLQALQDRLVHAALAVDPGEALVDFQTADLGQPYMSDDLAWTTRHRLERRKGGSAAEATTIRRRHYRAGALTRVALTLEPETAPGTGPGGPDLDAVAAALARPARPLFLGRKACLPATPLLPPDGAIVEAADLLDALAARPVGGTAAGGPTGAAAARFDRAVEPEDEGTVALSAQWPAPPAGPDIGDRGTIHETLTVVDRRDWANQIHGSTRPVCRGRLRVALAPDALDAGKTAPDTDAPMAGDAR
ncbi:MAG: type I-E CRISPR-associated protein Cas5/CasD [Azospirillaceae bacterium]